MTNNSATLETIEGVFDRKRELVDELREQEAQLQQLKDKYPNVKRRTLWDDQDRIEAERIIVLHKSIEREIGLLNDQLKRHNVGKAQDKNIEDIREQLGKDIWKLKKQEYRLMSKARIHLLRETVVPNPERFLCRVAGLLNRLANKVGRDSLTAEEKTLISIFNDTLNKLV